MKKTLVPLRLMAATLVLASVGCSTVREMERQCLIEKHYITPFSTTSKMNAPVPVTLRVNRIESLPPSITPTSAMMPRMFVQALTPVASLWLPSGVEINTLSIPTEDHKQCVLCSNEIATILTKEINKCGVVKDIRIGGSPADFDLRGTVNFYLRTSISTYGLGLFSGLAFLTGAPAVRGTASCAAHFQLLSRDGSTVLLDKSYAAERGWTLNIANLTPPDMSVEYGQKIFPDIVLQLMTDLLNIPPEKWIVQPQSGSPAIQQEDEGVRPTHLTKPEKPLQ